MESGDLITQFNWVDILVVTILFRSAYIGIKQGFVIEIFKISGLILTSYVTLHYYSRWGNFLAEKTPVSQFAGHVFFYLAISFLALIMLTLIRKGLLTIMHIETMALLKQWGGLILGFARGFFAASIICLFLFLFNSDYLRGSVRQAYSGKRIISISPATYKFIFNNLVVKFVPEAELNQSLFDVLEEK